MTDEQIITAIREKLAKGEKVSVHWLRKAFNIGFHRASRLLALATEEPGRFAAESGLNPEMWDAERVLINKWGVPGAEYRQIKVWLRPKEVELAQKIEASLKANPPILPLLPEKPGGLMALLSLFDLHVGMLAWANEVGENYDTGIAIDRMLRAASALLEKVPSEVERIVVPIGNDLLHADTHNGTTAAGTQLDVDSRWQKAFTEAASAIIRGPLAWAAEKAPVHVVIVQGNHDYQRSFYLGEVIRWYYEGRELSVSVDNSPRLRKYIRYGRVLLGFTHGSWIKLDNLPMIMAEEARKDWGEAEWREWVIGHYHAKREMRYGALIERGGVRVRVMPSLASTDAWHYQQGFVGRRPEATLSLYDQDGLIAEHYTRF